jgi:hypothetical protein
MGSAAGSSIALTYATRWCHALPAARGPSHSQNVGAKLSWPARSRASSRRAHRAREDHELCRASADALAERGVAETVRQRETTTSVSHGTTTVCFAL